LTLLLLHLLAKGYQTISDRHMLKIDTAGKCVIYQRCIC